MATIKNKTLDIYRENPNGTSDNYNTHTQLSIRFYEGSYTNPQKCYYLDVSPCSIQKREYNGLVWDDVCMSFSFGESKGAKISLVSVSRRNAKTQRTLEAWLETNADAINSAFIARGKDGAKEAVRDLFHIA